MLKFYVSTAFLKSVVTEVKGNVQRNYQQIYIKLRLAYKLSFFKASTFAVMRSLLLLEQRNVDEQLALQSIAHI